MKNKSFKKYILFLIEKQNTKLLGTKYIWLFFLSKSLKIEKGKKNQIKKWLTNEAFVF